METGSYPGKFTNSRKLRLKASRRIMIILRDNWDGLVNSLTESRICYRGISREDILLDTFEHVVRDPALRDAPDSQVLEAFNREFRQLHYRAVKSAKAERRSCNANDIQAEEEQ